MVTLKFQNLLHHNRSHQSTIFTFLNQDLSQTAEVAAKTAQTAAATAATAATTATAAETTAAVQTAAASAATTMPAANLPMPAASAADASILAAATAAIVPAAPPAAAATGKKTAITIFNKCVCYWALFATTKSKLLFFRQKSLVLVH